MSSTVPRYGYSSRPIDSCMVLGPFSVQALCRPRKPFGCSGEDLWVSLLAIFEILLVSYFVT
jgi:hypothetical protein